MINQNIRLFDILISILMLIMFSPLMIIISFILIITTGSPIIFSQIRVVTVDKIQNVVSNFFNIPLSDMLSQRRSRPLARPRQIAMFLAKKMTSRSLPEIGRRFANRDHTTVIHAVKTITRLSEQDDEMKKNINQLKGLLLEQ